METRYERERREPEEPTPQVTLIGLDRRAHALPSQAWHLELHATSLGARASLVVRDPGDVDERRETLFEMGDVPLAVLLHQSALRALREGRPLVSLPEHLIRVRARSQQARDAASVHAARRSRSEETAALKQRAFDDAAQTSDARGADPPAEDGEVLA